MTDARTLLEGKTNEELINEVLERRQEIADLETELAGLNEAETISDSEADKYSALLREADYLALYYHRGILKDYATAGFPDEQTFLDAERRHRERLEKYAEFAARPARAKA